MILFLILALTENLFAAILLLLHSFWVPQIKRNVYKGSSKALRKRYVVGSMVGRSYFLLCEFDECCF